MIKKMIFMAIVALSMKFVLSAIQPADAFAGCHEDCYTNCCGDEGICNSDDEQSCVTDCIEDCGSDSDSGSPSLARPDTDSSRPNNDDEGDADDIEILPDKKHRPVGGVIEPHLKEPNGKQPADSNQEKP
jgi:hypothetical protein